MKNFLIVFVLISLFGCRSEKIDLTGKFDVALNNRVLASLTLIQNESKLKGFFEWTETGLRSRSIYEVDGNCVNNSKTKTVTVIIYVKNNEGTMYVLNGNATNSNLITGSFEQRPAATRTFTSKQQSWISVRK